jgi:hypothetical protein
MDGGGPGCANRGVCDRLVPHQKVGSWLGVDLAVVRQTLMSCHRSPLDTSQSCPWLGRLVRPHVPSVLESVESLSHSIPLRSPPGPPEAVDPCLHPRSSWVRRAMTVWVLHFL